MKQLLLIVNPISGTKKAGKFLAEIIGVFNQAGYDTRVFITAQRGDATNAMKAYGGDKDLVVCCGGDGTLNETVTGLIEGGFDVPIGYIPSGSTNDFAGSLGLSTDVVEAAKRIAMGKEHTYDLGCFADRYFAYVASFGAFTQTSYSTSQDAKNALGHFAYILQGIQDLPRIRKEHIRMELDGEVLEGDYLFGAISNSNRIGGVINLNPNVVDLSDGKLDILLVKEPKDIQQLYECDVALRTGQYNCGMITFRSASHIRITADSGMYWTLDGERAEGQETVIVENLHRRLRLVH